MTPQDAMNKFVFVFIWQLHIPGTPDISFLVPDTVFVIFSLDLCLILFLLHHVLENPKRIENYFFKFDIDINIVYFRFPITKKNLYFYIYMFF